MTLVRPLSWLGPEPWTGWRGNLLFLRLFVLLHVAARSFMHIVVEVNSGDWARLYGASGAGVTAYSTTLWCVVVACVGGLLGAIRFRAAPLWACRIATLLVLVQFYFTMPFTANHVFLELVILALLAMLDERDEHEAGLLLSGLRWVVVVFFFYTGVQKVLYGTYFDGQFLGFMAAREERFQWLFQHVLPAEEFERLKSHGDIRDGAGPYAVRSGFFVFMSNVVYIFEIVAPILLCVRRTRIVAAFATIGFMIMIQAGAREIVFGALMISLLTLFLPWRLNKILFPVWVLYYAYLCAAVTDGTPWFHI